MRIPDRASAATSYGSPVNNYRKISDIPVFNAFEMWDDLTGGVL
jgi:hypothetical protein